MPRLLPVLFIALLVLPTRGDEPMSAAIAGTAIQIPLPAGMIDAPPDYAKALADMTPTNCTQLRGCIEADWVNPTKPQEPNANMMSACVYSLNDAPQDIYSGDFIDFVGQVANDAVHGVLESANSCFDFEETQKRLAAFQKDTGVAVQPDGALYSLGMVSRSGGCVSFMTAHYFTTTVAGKTERDKCITVQAYLLLNKKVVLVLTSLDGPTILSGDILPLKHAAEKFQIALQILNK